MHTDVICDDLVVRWAARQTPTGSTRPVPCSTAATSGSCNGSPAVLIADNGAVEAHPATRRDGCCATLPLHEHCLCKPGIHLGELWHLTPLARWWRANGRHRFLLTAPPLRLPGAAGSPVTPVATV